MRYCNVAGKIFTDYWACAIAGILAKKKYIPESAGTLKTDTGTFGIMVFAVIFIVAALSFLPCIALGPIAEFFGIK